jgi:rRNA-processing protein FCF1
VWLFGPGDDTLVRDVEATGALVVTSDRDAQAELVSAQRVAIATSQQRGLDPDNPRHLTRSVILAG